MNGRAKMNASLAGALLCALGAAEASAAADEPIVFAQTEAGDVGVGPLDKLFPTDNFDVEASALLASIEFQGLLRLIDLRGIDGPSADPGDVRLRITIAEVATQAILDIPFTGDFTLEELDFQIGGDLRGVGETSLVDLTLCLDEPVALDESAIYVLQVVQLGSEEPRGQGAVIEFEWLNALDGDSEGPIVAPDLTDPEFALVESRGGEALPDYVFTLRGGVLPPDGLGARAVPAGGAVAWGALGVVLVGAGGAIVARRRRI